MSLQQAKKLAEVREQVDVAGKKLGVLHDNFRKEINDAVVSDFRSYLEANGFKVKNTTAGAEGVYKDLQIKLVLSGPEERYIGIYHSFDIVVNNKKNDVRVVPKFTGVPARPAVRSGDPVQLLEQDLQQLNEEIENIKMQGFTFDCTQKGSKHGSPALLKATMAEVIDFFAA